MTCKREGSLVAVLWFAAATAVGASGPLEVSVGRAQAMLIKEDLGDGVFLYRAPSDLDYWTSTNSVFPATTR